MLYLTLRELRRVAPLGDIVKAPNKSLNFITTYVCLPEIDVTLNLNKAFYPRYASTASTFVEKLDAMLFVHDDFT